MRRLLIAATITAAALASPVLATDDLPHAIDVRTARCMEANPSTSGLLECSNIAGKAWDVELNRVYQTLTAVLTGPALEALKQSQRAWIVHREKEFVVHEHLFAQLSGTMWGPVMADQRVLFIKKRAVQLRVYSEFLKDGR